MTEVSVRLPTTAEVFAWLKAQGHSKNWLALQLGMDLEDVLHCQDVGFDSEDLATISALMKTH